MKHVQQPKWWFLCALCVLCPTQWLCIANSPWFTQPPKPSGDGPDYENIAYHLWQGSGFVFDSSDPDWREIYQAHPGEYPVHLDSTPRCYATTARPPLFPLVVAGIYGWMGRNDQAFAAVRLFSATCLAVAGALAVRMTVLIVPRFSSWRTASLVAGGGATMLLFAVNRTLRDYPTDFLTEPLALLLMQIFVSLAVALCLADSGVHGSIVSNWPRQREIVMALGAGVVFGGLILTRSMFVVWLPAIWILFVCALPLARISRIKLATLVVVAACLICSPWWLRNCLVLDRWMPLGTQGATTLLGGYSDAALAGDGDWQAEPEQRLRQELSRQVDFQLLPTDGQREVAVSQEASRRVRGWLKQHLDDLPALVAKRVYVHWNPYTGASLLWKVPLILGAIGLLVRRERVGYWLLGLPLVSTVVVAGFYATGGRFLVPLYGVLFTLAGVGVGMSVEWLARRCSQSGSTYCLR